MLHVSRVDELAGRPSTLLENGLVRVLINDKGGMTPEFSLRRGNGYQNAHWTPPFRATGDLPYREEMHAAYWETELLYSIAGNFPCAPSFGPQHYDGAVWYPTHGFAANGVWRYLSGGVLEREQAAYAIFDMPSPAEGCPIDLKKIDLVIAGQPVHYMALRLINRSACDMEVNIGYHNTLGSPFLQSGCVISLCADRFATPPLGGEFDETGRLAVDAAFDSLAEAPLRTGKTADISAVPGMNGYTDFVCGAVPPSAQLGWSAVVNPVQQLVYLCFFDGPSCVRGEEIALRFNDLWLQFGGRNFEPWSTYRGAPDSTYCLAIENAVGAFATGLANAKRTKTVLHAPTTLLVPKQGSRILYYGVAYAPYDGDALSNGIASVEREQGGLRLVGKDGQTSHIAADAGFAALRVADRL